ncbi:hypothetical protein PybrP1_000399, partial [[Pythium] brassicae (nom. inval.)]
RVRELSGARSFLVARGALTNASIFRREGMLPYTDVVKEYLKAAAETGNLYHNTKYNLARMIPSRNLEPVGAGREVVSQSAASVSVADLHAIDDDRQMFALWDLQNCYDQTMDRFRAKARTLGLYCNACHVQLANEKEVALHNAGKKHKRRVRDVGAL